MKGLSSDLTGIQLLNGFGLLLCSLRKISLVVKIARFIEEYIGDPLRNQTVSIAYLPFALKGKDHPEQVQHTLWSRALPMNQNR